MHIAAPSSIDSDLAAAFAPFAAGPVYLPVDETATTERVVSADEFMFMDATAGPRGREYRLKHRATRNYLIVYADGRTFVPFEPGVPFLQGFFGEAPEPLT